MVNLVCEAILPDCPMKDVEEIEKSIVTTYKKSIWSKFLKAISDFDMIQDGDKIAIGVSGGKDSLLLVKLFQELKKDRRKNFEFKAVSLNPGFRNSDLDNFKNNGRYSKCQRFAVAIGNDADDKMLKLFAEDDEHFFIAENASDIVDKFKQISMSVSVKAPSSVNNNISTNGLAFDNNSANKDDDDDDEF